MKPLFDTNDPNEWRKKADEFKAAAPDSFDPQYFRKLARQCQATARKLEKDQPTD